MLLEMEAAIQDQSDQNGESTAAAPKPRRRENASENATRRANRSHDAYQPLDEERNEIRLLLVKAGSGSTRIQCNLQQAFLTSDPKPEYETISYCWGNHRRRTTILLDGERKSVPVSAEAALRRMRSTDTDRVIWIDSVCINQADPKERGHQVSIMHEIFSQNQQNLIYLGEDDGTVPKALEVIKAILENASKETNQYQTWATTTRSPSGHVKYSETGLGLDIDVKCLRRFFAAPWFGRLWVAQEASLSRINTCHFGLSRFPLEDVLRAAAWLVHKYRFLTFSVSRELNIVNAYRLFNLCGSKFGAYSSEISTTLWDLLEKLQNFEAMDPRDHLYGVLGLYQKWAGSSILTDSIFPDYRSSLQTVLRDATRFIIWEEDNVKCLKLMDRCPWDTSVNEPWPSWVPRWHLQYNPDSVPAPLGRSFSAHDHIRADIKTVLHDQDLDQLTLSGYAVDSVSHVTPVFTREDIRTAEQISHIVKRVHTLLDDNSIWWDIQTVGKTLIAGINYNKQRATEQECISYFCWLNYTERKGERPPMLRDLNEDCNEDTLEASRYDLAFHRGIKDRPFFVTQSGAMGLGTPTMKAGDIVAILYGCDVPIILRPHGEYHTVQGPCYVHGIMDGEAVRKFHKQGREEDVFIVR